MVGPDPSPAFPRFFERCIEPRETLFSKEPLQRTLFRLGPETGSSVAVTELPSDMERLPEALAAVGAVLRGREVSATDAFAPDRLAELAARLKAARYAVIVWVPAMVDAPAGALVAQALLDIVRHLNQSTRCAILALGGNANLIGVNQVCLWQTGYPLRTGFGRGVPEHDPYRFSASRMLADGEADALVWISAFGMHSPPAQIEIPTILLAPAASDANVAAYIPVGTPGIDHAGQLFRTDVTVALRLPALRRSTLPDVASMMARIERCLAQAEPVP
jgi:formylmethanofuran dehydrogenase subunit B